jgi:hypothetical protein
MQTPMPEKFWGVQPHFLFMAEKTHDLKISMMHRDFTKLLE